MNKFLLAAAVAAGLGAVNTPQAHAIPTCAGLLPDHMAYQRCVDKAGGKCENPVQPGALNVNFTCVYPDGGRDLCEEQTPLLGTNVSGHCRYFPPVPKNS
jgi:hypothetical protein